MIPITNRTRSRRGRPAEGVFLLAAALHRSVADAAQRYAGVLRDHVGDAAGHEQDRGVIVALAEDGDGFATEAANFAVGEDGLQAVAYLGPVFVVVDGEENQDAAIGLLGTDAPLCGQVESVVDDWLAVGGGDGDYGDLCVGFLVDFGAESGELVAGGLA